ncbi:MAG: ADP-ribosyl-[dinitrogen reductase] hydrolase [Deferribacteres bacterium]|jgi:ADP-ribosyl-[dinitrogen reductase] hydrolase|nr:ADP-ribosyl-[dinitrogen reductase] hydrolase [Deferribacteres bacterium]
MSNENFDRVSDCLHSQEVLNVLNEKNFAIKDKIKGMIAGNIIGDMLGLPLEGKKGNISPYPPLNLKGDYISKIGEIWSDDTSMLIALATSLFETGGNVNPENERKHYLKWFLNGYYTPAGKSFGYGETTKQALLTGIAGNNRNTNGNGALMRSCILTAYYLDKTDRALEEASAASCAVTHGHPVSIFTNIIYNYILKQLIYGISLEDSMKMAQQKYSGVINDINEIFEKPVFYTTTAYCVTTLQTAIFVNLESTNFYEAVVKSANLGGDADTVAAVTGAIAGATYGFTEIYEPYRNAALKVISNFQALKIFFQEDLND